MLLEKRQILLSFLAKEPYEENFCFQVVSNYIVFSGNFKGKSKNSYLYSLPVLFLFCFLIRMKWRIIARSVLASPGGGIA